MHVHLRFRRQNNNSEVYESPVATIFNESKTTIAPTIPIDIDSEEENKYDAPEVKEVLEPQIKSIPDIEENIVVDSEEEVKKYVPQVKLVEEPETPPMTTSSTPSTTAAQEPSEKEARTYKPITRTETKHEPKLKGDDYINPVLDKKFPNFFTRFQKIFGDTRSSFFVKLQ